MFKHYLRPKVALHFCCEEIVPTELQHCNSMDITVKTAAGEWWGDLVTGPRKHSTVLRSC